MQLTITRLLSLIVVFNLHCEVFGNENRAKIDELCQKINEVGSIVLLKEMSLELDATDKKYLYHRLDKYLSNADVRSMFLTAGEKDTNGSVRAYAIRSLSRAGDNSKEYHQILLRILAEKPPISRSVAAKAAASSRVEEALPLIIGLLGVGRLDEKVYVLDILLDYGDDLLEYRDDIKAHFEGVEKDIENQRKVIQRNKNFLADPNLPANRAKRNLDKLRELFAKPLPPKKNTSSIVSSNDSPKNTHPVNTTKNKHSSQHALKKENSIDDQKTSLSSIPNWIWFTLIGGLLSATLLIVIKSKK